MKHNQRIINANENTVPVQYRCLVGGPQRHPQLSQIARQKKHKNAQKNFFRPAPFGNACKPNLIQKLTYLQYKSTHNT